MKTSVISIVSNLAIGVIESAALVQLSSFILIIIYDYLLAIL